MITHQSSAEALLLTFMFVSFNDCVVKPLDWLTCSPNSINYRIKNYIVIDIS